MKSYEDRRIARIWSRYKRYGSPLLRNALMEHYMPLVKRCATRMHSRLPASVQLDDLISAGVFGLAEAVEAYDIDRPVQFTTFSGRRIHGSMVDELRSMDWIPRQVRNTVKTLDDATRQFEAERGRQPSHDEMADRLCIPLKRYIKLEKDARCASLLPLEETFRRSVDGRTSESRQLPDTQTPGPEREVLKRSVKEFVLRGLSRAERLVVLLYYYEDLTMREVGDALDLSESRVSQMHTGIIARLRATTTEATFREHAA